MYAWWAKTKIQQIIVSMEVIGMLTGAIEM